MTIGFYLHVNHLVLNLYHIFINHFDFLEAVFFVFANLTQII